MKLGRRLVVVLAIPFDDNVVFVFVDDAVFVIFNFDVVVVVAVLLITCS